MADDEKQQALIGNGEQLGVVDAAMARTRSRALDLAVSQGVRQAQLHQQQVAQSQQPSIVRWERFLPQQQLRVLLVEDDDSTGHVVTALLRNCGYEVTFVPSGLWAWELLMDQSCKVDLVLTEVVMPGLSGIGLLSRILNHEPLKHIPVIMMSSLDSMGVVFKCLSKGAVDFLVKPVRKNELKNLWQHIWRRCHSSSGSGSGSGSGSQMQIVTQPNIAGEANNHSGSDNESDRMSSEMNLEGESDNGSGTQSSWTKKAVEVESSRQDISGGLRKHSSIQSKNGCLLGLDYDEKRKDNGPSMDTNLADYGVVAAELPFFCKNQVNLNSPPEIARLSAANVKDIGQTDNGFDSALPCADWQMGNGLNETLNNELESAAEHQADSEDADDLLEKHTSNSPSFKDKTFSDSNSPSLLKLSLKRPLQVENDTEGEIRGALKRSCSSAFSRYNNSGSNTPLPAGTISAKINAPANVFGDRSLAHCSSVGSSHPLSTPLSDTPFSNIGPDESMASTLLKGIPHGSGNQNGSLAHTSLSGKGNLGPCFNKEGTHPSTGSGMQSHFYPSPEMQHTFGSCKEPFSADINLPPHWAHSSENAEVQEFHIPRRSNQDHQGTHANQDSEVHHHSHHHHHHHHHHVQHHYHRHDDQPQQRPQTPQLEDSTVIDMGASAPKCGSSSMEKWPEDINGQSGSCNGYGSNGNGAVSLNGSATGSNGGQSAAAAEPAGGEGNVDSNTQIGSGSGLTVVHGYLLAPDESRHARREAALNKFRQKRKERCFEKKVRYQSRKRLAEQRPRVRGQFVKQCVK